MPDGMVPTAGQATEWSALLRPGFEERLRALREAAKTWGVRSHSPEGAFISTMVGTQEGFVEVALGLASGLEAVIADARTMAIESAEQQRKATAATQDALGLARQAAHVLETEKLRVTSEMVAKVAPQLV